MNQQATWSLIKFIQLHCSLILQRSALLCSLRSPHPQRSASLTRLAALRFAPLRCSFLLTCSTKLRSQLTKSAFLVVLAPPSLSILGLMRKKNMKVRLPSLSCVDDDDVAVEDVEHDVFGAAMLVVATTTTKIKSWIQACT